MYDLADLKFFVTESNRIEGINRSPTKRELQAHADFLSLSTPQAGDIARFVAVVAPGKKVRDKPGMDVRVGHHIPPLGGPHVLKALWALLERVYFAHDPFEVHVAYEKLHPFMDGNGRSGRAIWLWQMLNQQHAPWAIRMGFLHLFYYQTLSGIGRVSDEDGNTRSSSAATSAEPSAGEG